MIRIFLFACILAAALVVAVVLRVRDAPYIAYERGEVQEALEGLTRRAETGDGFAAFLVARIYQGAKGGPVDLRTASAWHMAAAQAGEIRAVDGYLTIVLAHAPSDDACRKAVTLLELATRTGDIGALTKMGDLYRGGQCVPSDLVRAASYFAAAAQRDRRMGERRDHLITQLTADQRRAVRPLPATFDLDARTALARFVSEAPALLPDNLR